MVATGENCGWIAAEEAISRIQVASASKRNPMHTREALLPDAQRIHELISAYSSDGTLLPRTLAEICESIRDFVVLEKHGKIIGCGALHLFGPHLAEIRSITVAKSHQKHGGGEQLVQSLMSRARKRQVSCICLFTRSPQFFAKLGFETAQRSDLPEKINKDCCVCPRYNCCDEVAMVKGELPRFAILPEPRNALVKLQVRAQLGSGGQ
jgi:amino-acid N-acetyltransferase